MVRRKEKEKEPSPSSLAGDSAASSLTQANVKVAVRLRPMNSRERLAGSDELILCHPPSHQIAAGPDHAFTYDAVFGPESFQDELFDQLALPLLESFIQGFNCTILAYGQTGSGKTFTMGTGLDGNLEESTQGLIPRSVNFLMYRLGQIYGPPANQNSSSGPFFEIYTSFLEIYNEEIVDLLGSAQPTSGPSKRKGTGFSIREDAKGEIYLTGLREEKIVSVEEIFALLQKGSLSRTTKSTEMNMVSSRSHAIFTLLLRQRGAVDGGSRVITSKLHFVDLAGSERLKRTGAQGDRAKESISINSGLLALGNVISALGDVNKRSSHIPYRNSKLTRLLQDSLGGNSRTLMIACASPSSDNFVESLNTLKYADRAKHIKNTLQINEELGGNGAFEVAQLKKQIAALKQEILHLRTSRRSDSSDALNSQNLADASKGTFLSNSNGLASSAASAELARIRVQNSELKRRLTQMSKEKATIEAERDAFKSAANSNPAAVKAFNVKLVAELKARITELESLNSISGNVSSGSIATSANINCSSNLSNNSNQPQTPVWLRQANALVTKARDEIRENLKTIRKIELDTSRHTFETASKDDADGEDCDEDVPMTPSKFSSHSADAPMTPSKSSSHSSLPSMTGGILQLTQAQFAAAVATRCDSLMRQVRSDLGLKEDLIRQFEICQAEYTTMRRNYDEKMRLVHENLLQAQKERDIAIKKVTGSNSASSNTNTHNTGLSATSIRRYEERIKSLGKELNVARASLSEAQKALQSRATSAESSLKALRTQLEAARAEKSKLLARLADETSKLKNDCFAHDSEIAELRQREYRATESARKLKKAFDFQKALLQKRIEQNQQARAKIRQLLLALKKNRNGSLSLTEDDDFDLDGDGIADGVADERSSENEVNVSAKEKIVDFSASSTSIASSSSSTAAAVDGGVALSDEDEIMLQLNEQTEAALNTQQNESENGGDIVMMEIEEEGSEVGSEKMNYNNNNNNNNNISYIDDSNYNTSYIDDSNYNTSYNDVVNYNNNNNNVISSLKIDPQTGQVPLSALRHSPLVSRRRDVFAKLDETKPTPFK